MSSLLDPVVLCFVTGVIAGLARSDLEIPKATYDTISIYLLLSIGLRGGTELSVAPLGHLAGPAFAALLLGLTIPCVAYVVLRRVGRFAQPDAASLAAHYGSVSAVTFAVVTSQLRKDGVEFEEWVSVLLVVLEVPALVVGVALSRLGRSGAGKLKAMLHEVAFGKSIFLLLAGLVIATIAGKAGMAPLEPVFVTPFKGVLALFLLELGLVCSRRVGDLRRVGVFLVAFAMAMPLVSAALGLLAARVSGLGMGGAVVLATLAASASYIAAPAAMRIAVPEANPSISIAAALGVTFPFNLLVGIPLYRAASAWLYSAA